MFLKYRQSDCPTFFKNIAYVLSKQNIIACLMTVHGYCFTYHFASIKLAMKIWNVNWGINKIWLANETNLTIHQRPNN